MGIDNGHAIRGSDDRIGAFQQNDATEISRCAAGALALRFDSRHRLFSLEKALKFPFMRRDDNAPLSSFFSDQPLEGRCIPSKARQSIGIEHHGLVGIRSPSFDDERPAAGHRTPVDVAR